MEYVVALGGRVARDSVVARVHDVERTGVPPVDYCADINGILIGRHFPGLIAVGDVIGMIGVPNRTSAFTVSGGAAADHTMPERTET